MFNAVQTGFDARVSVSPDKRYLRKGEVMRTIRTLLGFCVVAIGFGTTAAPVQRDAVDARDNGEYAEEVEALLAINVPEGADSAPDRDAARPLPQVLLIGDSIAGGYVGSVQSQLRGEASVRRGNNGGTTISGLERLDTILADTQWDVIHFNWGLHDMVWQRRMKPEERGLDAYVARLDQLARRLRTTQARLIWATTTPWPPENYAYFEKRFGERLMYSPAEEKQWRDAALDVMRRHDIPVNDLHALLLPVLDEVQVPEDVHFNSEGSRAMAQQIATVIRPLLQARDPDAR